MTTVKKSVPSVIASAKVVLEFSYMNAHHTVPLLFGTAHVLVLIAIVVGVFLYRKRMKDRERATALKLDNIDLRGAIPRAPVHTSKASNPELESAFPNWEPTTPAYLILGVSAHAAASEIEEAYKTLLKQYHPDRFASWGKGYQTRAHHVVLLLQKARDELLAKSVRK